MVGSCLSACELLVCPPTPLQWTGSDPWYYSPRINFVFSCGHQRVCPVLRFILSHLHLFSWTISSSKSVGEEWNFVSHTFSFASNISNSEMCCPVVAIGGYCSPDLSAPSCHKYTLNHYRVCQFWCPNVLFSWNCIAWKWFWLWNFLRGCRIYHRPCFLSLVSIFSCIICLGQVLFNFPHSGKIAVYARLCFIALL
jgi:hypothetical protein